MPEPAAPGLLLLLPRLVTQHRILDDHPLPEFFGYYDDSTTDDCRPQIDATYCLRLEDPNLKADIMLGSTVKCGMVMQ